MRLKKAFLGKIKKFFQERTQKQALKMLEDLVTNRYKWSKGHRKAYHEYDSYFTFLGTYLHFDLPLLEFLNSFSIDFEELEGFGWFRDRSVIHLDTLDFATDALSSFKKVTQQVSKIKVTEREDRKNREHVLQMFNKFIAATENLIKITSESHGLDNKLVKLIEYIAKHFVKKSFIGTVQGLREFIVKNHEILMKKPKLFDNYSHLFFS